CGAAGHGRALPSTGCDSACCGVLPGGVDAHRRRSDGDDAHAVEDLAKTMFYAVIATLVVAPLALGDSGWYPRILGSRPVVWLGEISYEIFLVHVIVMEIVMVSVLRYPVFTGSMLSLFLVTLISTVPVAWVLHRLTRPRVTYAARRTLADSADPHANPR